jgi:hypothetical protein
MSSSSKSSPRKKENLKARGLSARCPDFLHTKIDDLADVIFFSATIPDTVAKPHERLEEKRFF